MELPGPEPCLVLCFLPRSFIAGRTPSETVNPGAGVMVKGLEESGWLWGVIMYSGPCPFSPGHPNRGREGEGEM